VPRIGWCLRDKAPAKPGSARRRRIGILGFQRASGILPQRSPIECSRVSCCGAEPPRFGGECCRIATLSFEVETREAVSAPEDGREGKIDELAGLPWQLSRLLLLAQT
jgi:hypothetical protein